MHIRKFHPDEKVEPEKLTQELDAKGEADDKNCDIWYSCDECIMKFKSNELLIEHKGKHEGNRPFSCEFCGMTFAHKFALKSHVLSHDDAYADKLKQKLKTINETTKKADKRGLDEDSELDETTGLINKKPRIKSDEEIEDYKCSTCSSKFVNQSNDKKEYVFLNFKIKR